MTTRLSDERSATPATALRGEVSLDIQAPAARVYAYLLDFPRHAEWTHNLGRVEQVSPGPVGVGTRFRSQEWAPPAALPRRAASMVFFMQGLLGGARSYSEAEITALEPDRRLAWVGWVSGRRGDFNRATWEVILEPRDGATHLIQRFVYLPGTPAARRMLAALGDEKGLTRACATNLHRLKSRLEQYVPHARQVSGG